MLAIHPSGLQPLGFLARTTDETHLQEPILGVLFRLQQNQQKQILFGMALPLSFHERERQMGRKIVVPDKADNVRIGP